MSIFVFISKYYVFRTTYTQKTNMMQHSSVGYIALPQTFCWLLLFVMRVLWRYDDDISRISLFCNVEIPFLWWYVIMLRQNGINCYWHKGFVRRDVVWNWRITCNRQYRWLCEISTRACNVAVFWICCWNLRYQMSINIAKIFAKSRTLCQWTRVHKTCWKTNMLCKPYWKFFKEFACV